VSLKRVLLAAPRGYCAGVDRAVDIVERALRLYGAPVYVRKQIVHNIHVVRDLERKGAVFVEEENEVPEGATVVLSAHGVAPEVYENSARRRLRVIDATCPLVTKVHLEARRFATEGSTILLIGHEGHEEVIGTSGEAPDHIRLVADVEEARSVEVPDPTRVSYLSQTTLSVDETNQIIDVLRRRFPEVSRAMGTPAYLIDDESEIDEAWFEDAASVGVTSGASAPEWLVDRVLTWLRDRGASAIEEVSVVEEHMAFGLPRGVRDSDLEQARVGS
jgi:4-hydroxy-3-methylbut-2-enyl diphosphate reductase